ncbi:SprB repeat-containing protein [Flavobacterium geliluteum]|uniref:Uncharacterized protein n=1 Tax=Flavobacterium geliluteum TaxID=2816120 RepID=A0A940XE21_9FLAO|nr:hypothetical protein [Flavobacterium geliluteum]MBP4137969.1 hypothetical protein [Flavobacterium geliluteum]
MKKLYFLFFIFFCGINMIWSQTEYGILFISDIDARYEMEQTPGQHYIQGGGSELWFNPNQYFSPIFNQEDFSYVTPNLSTRKINFNFYSYQDGCFISENKDFDIDNGNINTEVSFIGCFASTIPYLIHLNQPADTNRCIEQTIELNNGWNWKYSYDGTIWTDFTSEYQNQRSISFKIKELIGYENKSQIFFRTGYKTNFTNTVKYDIIPCSSDLLNTSAPNYTVCNYSNGDVTFNFSRPLEPGENYLFTRNPIGSNIVTSAYSNEVDKVEKTSATTFKWKDIPPGDYEFKFQNQFENNIPSTLSPVTYFTITPRQQLTFTTTVIEPNCHTDSGGISVTASGGTPPYFYILDNQTKKEFTTNPYIIPMLSEGIHNVIVIDSNNCIEK